MRHITVAAVALAIILMTALTITTADAAVSHTGTVLEATTSGDYTYIHVDENGDKFWVAAPPTYVLKGKTVTFEEQVWMPNFYSKALDRNFDKILFVMTVYVHKKGEKVAPTPAAKAAPAPAATPAPTTPAKDMGTFTVADVYAKKAELNGNLVTVKGSVVKVSTGIMGRDWVHVQDGTGEEGSTNNLVFRTQIGASPNIGDEVTAKGRLEANKDFGMGYFYAAIVEDAIVE